MTEEASPAMTATPAKGHWPMAFSSSGLKAHRSLPTAHRSLPIHFRDCIQEHLQANLEAFVPGHGIP